MKSTVKAKYYFREFVDTLVVALRQVEKDQGPIRAIHPVVFKKTLPLQVAIDTGDPHRLSQTVPQNDDKCAISD